MRGREGERKRETTDRERARQTETEKDIDLPYQSNAMSKSFSVLFFCPSNHILHVRTADLLYSSTQC